ncbi:MAG: MBL fold metallo-hydrolase [Verrucomicrobiaceae bacterium]
MSAFELTFLGTGTSVGVPMINCDCETCRSTDPRDKRTRSSIYIQTPECAFVVDTGPDFRTQCLRENIRRVDAVLITHPHMDHVVGFDDVRRFTIPEEAVMPVHGLPATLEAMQRIFYFSFNPTNRWRGYLKAEARAICGPFQIGHTEVIPVPVKHGNVETIGFLFVRDGRKLCAYFSDIKEPGDGTLEVLRGVDALIVDALRHTPHPTHMNFSEALAFAGKIGARQTWFTHIQCEIMHGREEQKLPEGVRIAYDGLRLAWNDL